MIVMVFEFEVDPNELDEYLKESANLRQHLAGIDGFISVERFENTAQPGRFVAIGYFENEDSVQRWRNLPQHRRTQTLGRSKFFTGYRLVMAAVTRDYTRDLRATAPQDSNMAHAVQKG